MKWITSDIEIFLDCIRIKYLPYSVLLRRKNIPEKASSMDLAVKVLFGFLLHRTMNLMTINIRSSNFNV